MKKTILLFFGSLTFAFAYGQDTNKNQPQLGAASTVENVQTDSAAAKTAVPAATESIDPASIPVPKTKPKDEKAPELSEGDPNREN